MVDDLVSFNSPIKGTQRIKTSSENSNGSVQVNQNFQVSDYATKELIDDPVSLSSPIKSTQQSDIPTKNSIESVPVKVSNYPTKELVDEVLLSSPIKDNNQQIKTPVKNSKQSLPPVTQQSLKISDHPIKGTRQIKPPINNSNKSAQLQVTQSLNKATDRHTRELVDPVLFSSPIKSTRQTKTPTKNSIESAPVTQQKIKVPDHHTKELIDPIFSSPVKSTQHFLQDQNLSVAFNCNSSSPKDSNLLPPENLVSPKYSHLPPPQASDLTTPKDSNLPPSQVFNSPPLKDYHSPPLKDCHSPPSQDYNSPALALASGQTPKPLEMASAAQPHSPFRFNAPQEDASQIEFESFHANRENLIPCTVQSPSLPAAQGQDCQDPKKDGTKTDVRPASKSKHKSNSKKKVFHRTKSGFLSSSSEESSPPLRGKRVIDNAPQSPHNQPEFNDAGVPQDQLDDNPCQVASSSRRQRNSKKSNQVSQNQRGRSRTSGSDSSENEQIDRRHQKKHKSASGSPISPKRRQRPTKGHSGEREERQSTPPSPIPLRQRKRGTSEDQTVEHKQISSRNKSNKRKRRMRRSHSKTGKNFWTTKEEKLLIREVERFYAMKNCMAHIISRHGPNGTVSKKLALRTSVNLKDKAVNVSEKKHQSNTIMKSSKSKRGKSPSKSKLLTFFN